MILTELNEKTSNDDMEELRKARIKIAEAMSIISVVEQNQKPNSKVRKFLKKTEQDCNKVYLSLLNESGEYRLKG